jgi:hypothetical protein
MIEPEVVAELTTDAIEAKVVGDEGRVLEVLQTILVDGTRLDALAFVVACVYTIACGLRAGEPIVIWPVRVNAVGAVRPVPDADAPGHHLFAAILNNYILGLTQQIRTDWVLADDNAIGGAVGAGVASAASMVRQRRAVLN